MNSPKISEILILAKSYFKSASNWNRDGSYFKGYKDNNPDFNCMCFMGAVDRAAVELNVAKSWSAPAIAEIEHKILKYHTTINKDDSIYNLNDSVWTFNNMLNAFDVCINHFKSIGD